MKKINLIYILINTIVICISCDSFEYSSYEVPPLAESEKNLTEKNLTLISEINNTHKDTFCFAIIADSHIEYNIMEKAINHIKKDDEISFLIHLGDITDTGLSKEYHWANQFFTRLKIPYLVLIGNHDYLSNGKKIYNQMYGASSFTFDFNHTKFVCFDDIVWENNNRYPDFKWLENNLKDSNHYNHVFVFSHIPPVSDQFDECCRNTFTDIVTASNVTCTFHGHVHKYSYEQYPNNVNTYCFTADYIKSRTYYKAFVSETSFVIIPVVF